MWRDATLVRLYYICKIESNILDKCFEKAYAYIFSWVISQLPFVNTTNQKSLYEFFSQNKYICAQLKRCFWGIGYIWKSGKFKPWMRRWLCRYFYYREDALRKIKNKLTLRKR